GSRPGGISATHFMIALPKQKVQYAATPAPAVTPRPPVMLKPTTAPGPVRRQPIWGGNDGISAWCCPARGRCARLVRAFVGGHNNSGCHGRVGRGPARRRTALQRSACATGATCRGPARADDIGGKDRADHLRLGS